MKSHRAWALAAVLALVNIATRPLCAAPYAVFVVHCEPQNADIKSFNELREMVEAADEHQVKLTIDFTPPWVEMIVAADPLLASVTQWQEAGHELGVHHHPYWVSQSRGTRWDGYTNTPQDQISADNPTRYIGDMDDYMELMNQLPGSRTSGTLGINYGQDVLDWPNDLLYSAEGHAFDEIVGRPQMVEYGGKSVWQMSHGLFWNATPIQIQSAYEDAVSGDIVAVVTHVSNYEASWANAQDIKDYFAFLSSKDPLGQSLVTVTEAMNRTVPEPATASSVLLGVLVILGRCSRRRPGGKQ